MSFGLILIFGTLALVIVGTAVGMLVSRNAVYAALFLAMNFATVALLYLILGAPFIAVAQVTVYAGAIMILFLFVIMLLGGEKLPGGEKIKGQRTLAILLGWYSGGNWVVHDLPRRFAHSIARGGFQFWQPGCAGNDVV